MYIYILNHKIFFNEINKAIILWYKGKKTIGSLILVKIF